MNGLDPKLETLLRQAKDGLSPTENDAQRISFRLQGALQATQHATQHASTPNPPETSGTWLSAAKLKPALVGAVLGLGVGIGVGYRLHEVAAEHSPPADTLSGGATPTASFGARAPSDNGAPLGDVVPSSKAEPVEAHTNAEPSTGAEANRQRARPVPLVDGKASGAVDEAVRTPAERRTRPNAAASTPVLTQPTPGGDAALVVDEVEQVRRVQRALAQGQPGLALRLLNTLDREMPEGRLLEERAAARAIARCMSDPSRGAIEYRAFSQRYAQSVHDKRVAGVCTKAKQSAPSGTQP